MVVFSGNLYEDIECGRPNVGCIMQSSLNSSVEILNESFYEITSMSDFIFDFSYTKINFSFTNMHMMGTLKSNGYIFHSNLIKKSAFVVLLQKQTIFNKLFLWVTDVLVNQINIKFEDESQNFICFEINIVIRKQLLT